MPSDDAAVSSCGEFDPDLYVPRQAGDWSQEDWTKWATDPKPERRLRSVVGPPGIGKSWFLCHLREQLDNNGTPCDTFFINLGKNVWKDDWNSPSQFIWLQDLCDSLQPHTIDILSLGQDFADVWPEFCRSICQALTSGSIVCFVDAFDEITDDKEQAQFEKELIAPLLQNPDPKADPHHPNNFCTRVIIARRHNQQLQDGLLKWEEDTRKLTPLKHEAATSQIDKRITSLRGLLRNVDGQDEILTRVVSMVASHHAEADALAMVERLLSTDEWIARLNQPESSLTGNPFMNNLFLAGEIGAAVVNTKTDVWKQVREEYLDRAGLSGDGNKELRITLHKMAVLEQDGWDPASWTHLDYKTLLRQEKVSLKFDELEPAFRTGVIQYIEMTGRYYIDHDYVRLERHLYMADGALIAE